RDRLCDALAGFICFAGRVKDAHVLHLGATVASRVRRFVLPGYVGDRRALPIASLLAVPGGGVLRGHRRPGLFASLLLLLSSLSLAARREGVPPRLILVWRPRVLLYDRY